LCYQTVISGRKITILKRGSGHVCGLLFKNKLSGCFDGIESNFSK
jgi:hypothetical protein